MLVYLTDERGFIYSFLEWEIVDKKGIPKNGGDIVYVDDLWIHRWYRNRNKIGIITKLAKKILTHKFSDNVKYVYWNVRKRDYKKSRLFKVDRLLKGDDNDTIIQETVPL